MVEKEKISNLSKLCAPNQTIDFIPNVKIDMAFNRINSGAVIELSLQKILHYISSNKVTSKKVIQKAIVTATMIPSPPPPPMIVPAITPNRTPMITQRIFIISNPIFTII